MEKCYISLLANVTQVQIENSQIRNANELEWQMLHKCRENSQIWDAKELEWQMLHKCREKTVRFRMPKS